MYIASIIIIGKENEGSSFSCLRFRVFVLVSSFSGLRFQVFDFGSLFSGLRFGSSFSRSFCLKSVFNCILHRS